MTEQEELQAVIDEFDGVISSTANRCMARTIIVLRKRVAELERACQCKCSGCDADMDTCTKRADYCADCADAL